MKILQLCKKVPYPLRDGESLAIHYLSKGLHDVGCEVDLLAFNTTKHFVEWDRTPVELLHYSKIETVVLDNSISYWAAFKNLWTSESYNIRRFVDSEYEALLAKLLQEKAYDIIQLETLYLAPYIQTIKKYSQSMIAMRSHNLEAEIWQNMSEGDGNLILRKYYGLCARRLNAFEQKIQNQYDVLLAISKQDLKKYHNNGRVGEDIIVPIGLDIERYKVRKSRRGNTIKIGYIGSLDWKPNIEGLQWLLSDKWRQIVALYPQLEFHLAGRNGSGQFDDLDIPSFVMHGEVEDAIEFMQELDILLVPLLSGSGMRVKILEAMMMEKIVISTAKGFEGIEFEEGMHAMQYNTLDDLVSCIEKYISSDNQMEKMSAAARNQIVSIYSNRAIAQQLKDKYVELL